MRVHTKLVCEWNGSQYVVLHEEGFEYSGEVALCDRAAQSMAKKSYGQALDSSTQDRNTSNQISSTLIPGLEHEANNPTGYTPQQENDMTVAGEQGAGGAAGGVVEQANLESARTGNTAGYGSSLDEAMREKGRLLSEESLGIKNASADVANKKQIFAQGQLGSLMSEKDKSALSAMGLETEDVNAEVNAGKSGWLQNTLATIDTLSSAGNAAANMKKAFS